MIRIAMGALLMVLGTVLAFLGVAAGYIQLGGVVGVFMILAGFLVVVLPRRSSKSKRED
jgi:hypothetical protein